MNFFNSDKDNIITLVKTLHPIKNIYSKQNKDFDKYFHCLSLKYLVNHMKNQKKYNPYLNPGESLDEPETKAIMNINFKSTFNYLDELNKVKSLPTLPKVSNLSNNIKIIKNKKKEKRKKIPIIKDRQKEIDNLVKKKMWDENVTLDPGRYCPKYDYIRKKIPCAFIGKPKNTEDDYLIQDEENKIKEETEKKQKKQKKQKNIQEKKSEEKSNINNKEIKNANPKNKTIIKESNSSKILNDKIKTKLDSPKKNNINTKSSNLFNKSVNNKIKISSQKSEKYSSSIIKHQNTASSWSNTLDLNNSKKLSEQHKSRDIRNISMENNPKSIYNSTQRINLKNNKKYILKNVSMNNLRCPIIFDKMQGREELSELNKKSKANYRINYNPDYNILRPHIPSIKFNSGRKYQEFKKYINGKIIRSYCYNPQQYFALEYKENKENEINGIYGTIMLNS